MPIEGEGGDDRHALRATGASSGAETLGAIADIAGSSKPKKNPAIWRGQLEMNYQQVIGVVAWPMDELSSPMAIIMLASSSLLLTAIARLWTRHEPRAGRSADRPLNRAAVT